MNSRFVARTIGPVTIVAESMAPNECVHGPQVWPWWKPLGLGFVTLTVHGRSYGWRLWVYLRRRSAWNFDIYLDGRTRRQEKPK